jgi:hypothetical protein
MRPVKSIILLIVSAVSFGCSGDSSTPVIISASSDLPVREDPLVRMPGTQPGQVTLESSTSCYACHGSGNGPWLKPTLDQRNRREYSEYDIFKGWQGSMMGNSARDPLMFACFTVAAQDSMYALGTPNAVDICLRCHFPKGWLEGRSSTLNASAMTGDDYDGVQCSFCHRLTDPFYKTTFDGTRDGNDWTVSWDEQNSTSIPLQFRSQERALQTYLADQMFAPTHKLFSGDPFFVNDAPFSALYTENAGGQYFVSPSSERRGPFADVFSNGSPQTHKTLYSRYHKSKFFCATCHDVSNPVMANLKFKSAQPGQKVLLDTETLPAFAWSHVERTFSEFRLSAYNEPGGSDGKGNFRPNTPVGTFPVNGWETDQPGNKISKCQDCHMCSRYTPGSNQPNSPVRPEESLEHPNTWTPCHALTGGNIWMTSILFSIAPDNPNRDQVNVALLVRPDILTMDVMQGTWQNMQPPKLDRALSPFSIADALQLAASRIRGVLGNAANITDLNYSSINGGLTFRVQNNSGHKLISGFPEGRRMFVNIKVYQGSSLLYEVNPYDYLYGTFKGFPGAQALGSTEAHVDQLVYEAKLGSTITGEQETMHFALATHRYKDNRIPPKGFNIAGAAARISEPVWLGQSTPDFFTAAEYAGGYDEVNLLVPTGATKIEVNLYYQTTSREYVEFLRDEINGTGKLTLPANAYVAQTHPFFTRLKAWGNTIFQLWDRNKNVDGGKPFLMTQGVWGAP